MNVSHFWRRFGVGMLGLGLASAVGAPARAQSLVGKRLSPDLLQTLGVGSRSIAMGNAFTAIADDASATFWNPGRLGFVGRREFMLEYRPVINSNFSAKTTDGVTIGSSGDAPSKPQLGFASFTYPLTLHHDYIGTVAISYTLGGYFSFQGHSVNINTPASTTTISDSSLLARDSYITLAYGKDFAVGKGDKIGRLGFGGGVFFVNEEYATTTHNTTIINGVPVADTGVVPTSERGHGVGVTAGLSYEPYKSPWAFGLAYRSKATMSGLKSGVSFGNEIPDRISLGTAYTTRLTRGQLIVSTEVQFLSAVNRQRDSFGNLKQTDQRRAVESFHLGFEYTPSQRGNGWVTPIRLGFETLPNAATVYTFYDNIVSFGVALQRKSEAKLYYSIEPTVEIQTSNGLAQYTITGRLKF